MAETMAPLSAAAMGTTSGAGWPVGVGDGELVGRGGIASIGSGLEAFFEADFTPGEYVLICMTTAPDGRSHIEHGMIQQISVR